MRNVILGVLILASLSTASCNKNADVQCGGAGDCDLSTGGECLAASTGNMWCAYPDPACPGGYRYSSQDVGDGLGGTCAPYTPTDGGIDAGPTMYTLTINVGGSGTGVVTSTPSGISCSGGTCTMTFPMGTQISLAQSASTGTFLGWSDDCIGAGGCAVTMNQDHKVTALFGTPGEALWSQQIGGTQNDAAQGITIDSDGNLIVVGRFQGSFLVGATTLTSNGGNDFFVAKLSSTDGSIAWIEGFGGTSDDTALRVAVDASNNIYVVGSFAGSMSFGTSATLTSAGANDGYILSLDTSGAYRWAKALGGTAADGLNSVSVASTTVAVGGFYTSSITVNGTTLTNGGYQQAYVAEFGTDGSAGLVKTFTGVGNTTLTSVVLDSNSGTIVVAGTLSGSADFGGGSMTSQSVDAYLAEYSSTGTYIFAKVLGGTSNDSATALAVSATGSIVLAGNFNGSVSFGGASALNTGTGGMVLVSYSLAGAYQWSEAFATTGSPTVGAAASDLATNATGDIVIAGYFCGSLSLGSNTVSSVGTCSQMDFDILAARFSGTDGSPLTATRAGGSMQDAAYGVTQTADGKHYVAGYFQGFADFGGTARTSAGGTDAIIVGLAPL
jgi:hypothetical protein